MNKLTACFIVIALTPIVLPVAVFWGIVIAASGITETWYRAWEALKE